MVGSLTSRYTSIQCAHSQPGVLRCLISFLIHRVKSVIFVVGLGVYSHEQRRTVLYVRSRQYKACGAIRYKYNAANAAGVNLDHITRGKVCASQGTLRNIYGPHGSIRLSPKCDQVYMNLPINSTAAVWESQRKRERKEEGREGKH